MISISIDDDILDLIDEVDPERELKEIAEALGDPDKFPTYVREKSAKAVSVFLVRIIFSGFYTLLIIIFLSPTRCELVRRNIYQKCQYLLREERWARDGS